MVNVFEVSTTGTLDSVSIQDLGIPAIPHPTVDFDLLTAGLTIERINNSIDLQFAVDSGYLTTKFNGVSVANVEESLSVIGGRYEYSEDDALSSRTNTIWYEKLKHTTSDLPPGNYLISWTFQWSYLHTSSRIFIKCELDDTVVLSNHVIRPNSASSLEELESGFKRVTLSSGVHYIDLDFRSGLNGKESRMWNARIQIWKVN